VSGPAREGGAEAAAAADAVALLRARGRGEAPPAPSGRVLELIGFARRHRVTWPVCEALSQVLPEGPAALLLRPAMAEAEARAEALAAQFRDLAARLSGAGLHPVALKGAAALAEAGGAARPEREMVDLDLLVPEAELTAAAETLRAAGYTGDAEAHVATDFHYPALFPPPGGGPATVELHIRPGWSRRGWLADLEARARPSPLPGMRVPSPGDRLAHLSRHAQIQDRGRARRALRLRDMLDWRRIRAAGEIDLDALARRLDAMGEGEAFRAFAVLMARLWDEPAPPAWEAAHAPWAEETLSALGDPAQAEAWRRRDRAPAMVSALSTRETLAHAVAGALNPARLRRFLASRRS
jgi:hypothetical protein